MSLEEDKIAALAYRHEDIECPSCHHTYQYFLRAVEGSSRLVTICPLCGITSVIIPSSQVMRGMHALRIEAEEREQRIVFVIFFILSLAAGLSIFL